LNNSAILSHSPNLAEPSAIRPIST
jgi:hypothetical protein